MQREEPPFEGTPLGCTCCLLYLATRSTPSVEKQLLACYWVLVDAELWTLGGFVTLQADISTLAWISLNLLINKM